MPPLLPVSQVSVLSLHEVVRFVLRIDVVELAARLALVKTRGALVDGRLRPPASQPNLPLFGEQPRRDLLRRAHPRRPAHPQHTEHHGVTQSNEEARK